MGLLSLLARPSPQASVSWSPLDPRWYSDLIGTRSDAGPNISQDTALQNSVVWRAIHVIANSVASIPLVVYRRIDGEGKERARDHMAYELLHTAPNAWQTSYEWRFLMVLQSVLWGNHYTEIEQAGNGIGALVPLSPETTRIVDQFNDGSLLYLTRNRNVDGSFGQERRIRQDLMLHVHGLSTDGMRGRPLTQFGKNAIGLALAAERHGSIFMRRGAKFSGFIKAPNLKPDSPEHKANEVAWQKMQAEGSATTPILTGDMSFEKLSSDNRATQWIEARTFQVEEILRFLGVPGVLVGYADKTATYASAEQFFLSFVTHTVRPWTEKIAAELNRSVITDSPNHFCEFTLEGLLKGDIKTRYSAHQLAIQSGWKTRNEVRTEENYNRGPEALDEFMEPLNFGIAGEEREEEAATPARPSPAPARRSEPDDDDEEARARRAQLQAIAKNAVTRLVQKEIAAIRGSKGRKGAAARYAGDANGWNGWLADFYAEHATAIAETLGVSERLAAAYCEAQRERLRYPATAGDTFEANSLVTLTLLIPGEDP